MSGNIRTSRRDGVLTLALDRPEKRNAITEAMYAALADSLEAAEADPEVRAVLLRAEGEAFTAGNDIGEFAAVAMGAAAPVQVLRFLKALARASRPVVAAVQGRAVGVGTTLLLHCDYVVLAEDAQLSTPFVNLALAPEAGSSLLLPARIGHLRAFEMFALGEPVSADTALAWGLANRVTPRAELVGAAEEIALRLARQPPGALAATKALMRDAEQVLAHMDLESRRFLERLTTAEAREAFTAFAERRAPDFKREPRP